MLSNRITSFLDMRDEERKRPMSAPLNSGNVPPANFVTVPADLLRHVPQAQLAWQQDLYRAAYQAALASVAASARAAIAERARWN
jgi:hypothetical protein